MSDYEYDVFISYARRGTAQKWLLNHFHRKLGECLSDEISPVPRVFMDRSMDRGVHWPSALQHALLRSKIMVQVLTPHYFESRWCMAEWDSMRERENLLGLASRETPQSLIYPILYSDSDNFPMEARERSWWDFKEFAYPDPGFESTRDYHQFHRRVVEFAQDLAKLLRQVPKWQADWPLVTLPEPVLIPPPPIPRFKR